VTSVPEGDDKLIFHFIVREIGFQGLLLLSQIVVSKLKVSYDKKSERKQVNLSFPSHIQSEKAKVS
jgi:hypothetical protein